MAAPEEAQPNLPHSGLSPVGTPSQLVLAPDPTQNVKDIVKATVESIEKLRSTDLINFNALRDADQKLVAAELKRVNDLMELQQVHNKELKIAEANRIDAIRAVDVNAVAIANERAGAQATVLANQVLASAEALRSQLSQTAAVFKQQLDQTTQQLSDRISVVERFQYEGKGSAGSIPPALAEQLASLANQVSALKESRDRSEGKSGLSTPILIAIAVAITGLLSFILQRLMITGGL